MSDDLDTRLTSIASQARACVSVGPAEIERALADITSGAVLQQTRMPETRRASAAAWLAVAAATVLVLTGGIWLTTRGDDQVATVTPASTAPTSPPAPTTVTTPELVTSTPQPPPLSSVPVAVDPFAGLTREPTGIERVCGEAGCTWLVADLDGAVYSCDPATATVTRHASPSTSMTLAACPFAIGPGAVAYSFESDDTGANFIVARSLQSGDELQSVPYEGSDADLVPTPAGLATVGMVLPSIPQPDLTSPPIVPWVLPDPSDARDFPVGVFEPGASPAITVADRRWVVGEQLDPSVSAISGIVATHDGGFLAVAHSRQTDTAYLVRGRPDGSTAGIPIDDPSAAPALLERSGTIVLAAGDTFVRVDPLEAFVPTTTPPAPPEPAATPPTSTAPTIDPFLSAIAVASTSNGVLLGQPDGSWAPAGFGALGKALLIDRWVVFQPNADPTTSDVPSIEIHETAGSTNLDDLGPARLLDVGWIAGEPVALVSLLSDAGTGWNAESLQLVDLRTPAAPPRAVADFDAVEGMRYAVNSAALGNDRIVLTAPLRLGTELVVMTLDGDVLYRESLGSTVGYEPTASGDEAWLWGLRFYVTGGTPDDAVWSTFLDVTHIDLATIAITRSSTELPPSDSYDWARFDGTDLGYTSTTKQYVFTPENGTVVERPDLPFGLISPRRAPGPPAR